MSSESDSPEVQKAKTFFQYGTDAAQKSNLDYAIEMYKQACKLLPDNLIYRQALRGVQRRKYNNEPGKVGMMAGARNQPVKLKARSARSKGNFAQALEACEDAFTNNPWDVGIAREAAEAAEGAGYLALAQWLVESVQAQATDPDFFRFSAHIHALNHAYNKAILCWEQVKKLSPNDENASRQIMALAASSTIRRSGLDDQVSKREKDAAAEASEEMASKLEELKRAQLSPEQKMIKEIQEQPNQLWPYLNLSDHYKSRGELEKAEKVLAQGLKALPTEAVMIQTHAEIQMSRLKKAMEALTVRCKERPDDIASKAKLDQLTKLLLDFEIKEYRRRVALHPEETNNHYQLGLCLARAGLHDDAIGAFQQSRTNPTLKTQSLYQMGLSFEANGALKLADRTYNEALKGLESNDVANFNAIHYRLGRVAEALGNNDSAEEHYNEVAANDYTYLDVAQRLRNLN